jgi:coenzyme PQQ biosynthesis protein PqqD
MKLPTLAAVDERGPSAAPGVLMVPERALQLNRTACDRVERCDGQLTLAQIIAQLSQRHGAQPQTVERDIASFVAELECRRILAFEGGS